MKIAGGAEYGRSASFGLSPNASEQAKNVEPMERSSKNLMEGNFVQQHYTRSKYIDAHLTGLRISNEFQDKMQGIVDYYSSQRSDNYAELWLLGQKASRAVGDAVENEVADAESKRMEKEREESEETAAERNGTDSEEETGISEINTASETSSEKQSDEKSTPQEAADAAKENVRDQAKAVAIEPGAPQGARISVAPGGEEANSGGAGAGSSLDAFV
jgi:hypothetical protein